ncbi:MAG: hypothetical protein FWD29_08725, partial [Micrococcales bacterium]|nr:hypothetical protein [Micrococcales bacterium]
WRLGQLMVRQSEDIRRVQMVLVASTAIEQFGGTGDFELAAGATSSLALSQLDQAGSVTVVANGATVRARPALRGTVLDLVAGLVVRPAGQGGETLATAAARARRDVPAVTLAILVTGVKQTLPALRAVTGYLPGQAWALAIRCQVGAATEVSQVGRLALATIGSLEALPKALRQLRVVG